MITKYLGLLDSYAVLVLPGLMTPFLIILMKNFIKSAVPEELFDSGKIDGAGDFRIYWQIVLKLSMPGIATVGLFLALYYWNDWFTSSLFINDTHKYQLQFYLYNVINSAQFIAQMGAGTGVSLATEVPAESTKMAMAIVVTGPILFCTRSFSVILSKYNHRRCERLEPQPAHYRVKVQSANIEA